MVHRRSPPRSPRSRSDAWGSGIDAETQRRGGAQNRHLFSASLCLCVKYALSLMSQTLIVGGGISGLSAAYYLGKSGHSSAILESRPRLGGVIQTERLEGCTVEA